MARLLRTLALTGIRKSDGTALASGRVWAVQPGSTGTTAQVSLYSDADGTIPLSQPLALDAAGRYQYAYTKTPFKIIAQDALGNIVAQADRADTVAAAEVELENSGFTGTKLTGGNNGSQAAGGRTDLNTSLTNAWNSLGGVDWQYQIMGAPGARVGGPRGVSSAITDIAVNAKSFTTTGGLNVKGDGLQVDTTGLQAGLNYLAGVGGGVFLLPPGTFLIDQLLNINGSNIIIRGSGSGATIIKQSNATLGAFAASARSNLVFEDLQITGSSATTAAGVLLTNVSDVTFNRCVISNFQISVDTTNSSATNRRLTILSSSLTHTGIAASRCLRIQGTTADGALAVVGSSLLPGALIGGAGVEIGGTLSGGAIIGVQFANLAAGFSHTNDILVSANGIPSGILLSGCAFAAAVSIASSTTRGFGTFTEVGNSGFSYTDSTNGTGVSTFSTGNCGEVCLPKTLAGGATLTPLSTTNGFANSYYITANGNITIANPSATSIPGLRMRLAVKNNTAGAITVTMGGQYHTTAAIAPAAGQTTTTMFELQTSGVWNEISRATVT